MREVEFDFLDSDGAAFGRSSKEIGDWTALERSGDVGVVGRFICENAPSPPGLRGPFATFPELWRAYQAWLHDVGAER